MTRWFCNFSSPSAAAKAVRDANKTAGRFHFQVGPPQVGVLPCDDYQSRTPPTEAEVRAFGAMYRTNRY